MSFNIQLSCVLTTQRTPSESKSKLGKKKDGTTHLVVQGLSLPFEKGAILDENLLVYVWVYLLPWLSRNLNSLLHYHLL